MDVPPMAGTSINLLSLPQAEKWERLKPEIIELYIDERKRLSEVIDEIRRRYGFTAPCGSFLILHVSLHK